MKMHFKCCSLLTWQSLLLILYKEVKTQFATQQKEKIVLSLHQ